MTKINEKLVKAMNTLNSKFNDINEFTKITYQNINSLTNEEYHLQEGKIKNFKEEVLPIAVFLKFLQRPGLDVFCKMNEETTNYDAEIKLTGYFVKEQQLYRDSYFLEVTTLLEENDYLCRESLVKNGYAGNDLRRDKETKEIINGYKTQAINYYEKHISEGIKKRFEKKNRKEYNENTVLLISIHCKPLTQRQYLEILKNIKLENSIFEKVFIIEPYLNYVFEL